MNTSTALFRHFCHVPASLILLPILLSACQGGLPTSMELNGRITKVHDGDSVHVTPNGQNRVIVRLAAIDAPEIKQDNGIASRDYLRSMIMDQQVDVRCNKVDKYRRQICVVSHEGKDINLEMLKAGHAWYYAKYKNEQRRSDQRLYKKAESTAKKDNKGLWATSKPIAPWEFRAITNN